MGREEGLRRLFAGANSDRNGELRMAESRTRRGLELRRGCGRAPRRGVLSCCVVWSGGRACRIGAVAVAVRAKEGQVAGENRSSRGAAGCRQ